MSDNNENQNEIFGGINFDGKNNGNAQNSNTNNNCSSFFEEPVQKANSVGVFGNYDLGGNGVNPFSFGGFANQDSGKNIDNGMNADVQKAGVFGFTPTVQNGGAYNGTINNNTVYRPIAKEKSMTKQGLWTKIKAFLFQEIDLTAPVKVELTPYQQKIENEINDFLHQEVSFKAIAKLFK